MKYRLLSSLIALSLCGFASAQELQSGYFMDNYLYRYRLNPAFANDADFAGIGIGNIGFDMSTKTGLDKFLFKNGNKLVTGLNSSVSSESFIGGLPDVSDLSGNLDLNIFSHGLRFKSGTYTTVEINLKGGLSTALPKDVFKFLKNGTGETLDLSSLSFNANSYAELVFGQSFNINEALRIGYRAKFLVGLASLKAQSTLQLNPGENSWSISGDATVNSSLEFDTKVSEDGSIQNLADFSKVGDKHIPAGYGGAMDLGATYTIFDDKLQFSAAILDLGGISWTSNYKAATKGGSWSYDGLDLNGVISDSSEGFADQFDKIKNEMMDMMMLRGSKETSSAFGMLPMTLNAGASYRIFKPLSVGALLTVRTGAASWTEGRAYLNFSPAKVFALTANAGIGTFGGRVGFAANFRLPFMNLFFGTDQLVFGAIKLGPVPVPYSPVNSNIRFGIASTF